MRNPIYAVTLFVAHQQLLKRELRTNTKTSYSESFVGKIDLLQYIQCSEAQMPLHEVVRVPPPGYHREVNATYWREISSTDHIHPQ